MSIAHLYLWNLQKCNVCLHITDSDLLPHLLEIYSSSLSLVLRVYLSFSKVCV